MEKPLASASIGQVHRAILKDGEAVAVKFQRPGIRKIIEIDLEIMLHLATLAEHHIEELALQRPVKIVDEFARMLEKEIIIFDMERDRYPGWPDDMLETMQEIGRDNFLDPWGTPYQHRNLAQGRLVGTTEKPSPENCRKNKQNTPGKIELKKYDPVVRKHVTYKEGKIK